MKPVFASMLLFIAVGIPYSYAFELVPHKAIYTANIKKGVSINGKAVRELKKLENGQWKYTFDVRSFAADIDESATFSLNDEKILPQRYRYKLDPILGSSKVASADFDWQKGTVKGSNKNKPWLLENIPPNTLDRLSYQLQLLKDINRANKPDYKVAHKGKLRPTLFETVGEELVDTKLGTASTIVVRKVRDESSKRQTNLWISKKYPMLLIKMTQTEKDGEQYEIHLDSAKVDGKAIEFDSKKRL